MKKSSYWTLQNWVKTKKRTVSLHKWYANIHFCFFSTCQKPSSTISISIFSYPGWHWHQVSKVLESNYIPVRSPWAELDFVTSNAASFKFPSTLPGRDLKPTPLWMEADISIQSAQASIEKNTVPCIPAGPKSCLVRKMAWSWYSAWSGSRRCCVLAHRHTCSRLRDGLPRSIRQIDCKNTKTRF